MGLSLCLVACEKALPTPLGEDGLPSSGQQPADQAGDNPADRPGDNPENSYHSQTLEADGVSWFSAILQGTLDAGGKSIDDAQVFFLVSEGEADLEELKESGYVLGAALSSDGSFSLTLDGLSYGMMYSYAACVKLGTDIYVGDLRSFRTRALNVAFTHGSVEDLTAFSAQFKATATIDGKGSVEDDSYVIYPSPFLAIGTQVDNSGALVYDDVLEPSADGVFKLSLLEADKAYGYVLGYLLCRYDKQEDETEVIGSYVPSFQTFQTKKVSDLSNAVNLGLSVKWASCNLGALRPDDKGACYAWAETSPKTVFNGENYAWCIYEPDGYFLKFSKYCPSGAYGYNGYSDTNIQILPGDDAATRDWGESWRMPTKDELAELCATCSDTRNYKWERKSFGETDAYVITCLKNGNSIIVPAAGRYTGAFTTGDEQYNTSGFYYWSSTLSEDSAYYAWHSRSDFQATESYYRYLGLAIRPVTP